ncbi:hypothetical protein B0H34DRAFT_802924 [Crassisporium funariophilum]|nr:hypothetical protein B0H34DRAFT_802924 [Crassisporium funariophilum]
MPRTRSRNVDSDSSFEAKATVIEGNTRQTRARNMDKKELFDAKGEVVEGDYYGESVSQKHRPSTERESHMLTREGRARLRWCHHRFDKLTNQDLANLLNTNAVAVGKTIENVYNKRTDTLAEDKDHLSEEFKKEMKKTVKSLLAKKQHHAKVSDDEEGSNVVTASNHKVRKARHVSDRRDVMADLPASEPEEKETVVAHQTMGKRKRGASRAEAGPKHKQQSSLDYKVQEFFQRQDYHSHEVFEALANARFGRQELIFIRFKSPRNVANFLKNLLPKDAGTAQVACLADAVSGAANKSWEVLAA